MSAVPAQIEAAFGESIHYKTYELSLTKTYVSRWGMTEAVRELIQNSLDSDSSFQYEFIRQDGAGDLWTLRLTSEHATLTPETLLLGATSKADRTDAIGSFGEGYKIALLVLTRLGYDTSILNGDLIWKPRFRFSRSFGADLLVVDEHLNTGPKNRGLSFLVHGLTEKDVIAIRASCLKMHTITGEVKTTKYGTILMDYPRKLFVGSLYVCDTEMRCGYNIDPGYVTLERDRQTVSGWELSSMTLKMWYDTGEFDRVAKMIADELPDVEHARYDSNEMVKEACWRLFRERHPGKLIAGSARELEEKVKQGMTETVYVGGGMYHAVSTSPSYRRELPRLDRPTKTPTDVLTNFLKDHRDLMRTKAIVAFKELIETSKTWKS